MPISHEQAADQAWQWLEAASRFSETQDPERDGVTRLCATQEHRAMLDALSEWMRGLGMTVRQDNGANLIGRHASWNAAARTLLLGSHQDTVPNGGKYDGIMGVILPLALIHYLRESRIELPFHIDVVAFSDEEGTRFSSTLLGSKVLAGTFDNTMLDAVDDEGTSLRQALIEFGCRPEAITGDAYPAEEVIAFIETHIEQGPQLELENLPVGVVSAITGIERHRLTVHGLAGHAGTVPMHLRQDALVGAARVIQLVDTLCQQTEDLVGVVGKIENAPNGVNVIPQTTTLSIELRSPDDAIRRQARQRLFEQIEATLAASGLSFDHSLTYEQPAVPCSAWLIQVLEGAVQDTGIEPRILFSGAGHDGLAMQALCDIGMLFLRCKGGVSHHPGEAIAPGDLTRALSVLENVCHRLAAHG
ncbi:M20 family metallo-hydrolase [Billgrantia montanilacus]|uniref:Zn-dependent hydrolase n=1 Tax=Billgrantia montanilacus TaxID=2282305 RepID=A0A368TZQ6_9GAMM|nr:M20 family metallo-hydrolase [Halomonas montanilacus]RCV88403.1 Zn-dependent hydrolase [Halomonas montanilacus]